MKKEHREEIKRLEALEDEAIKEGRYPDIDKITAEKWAYFEKIKGEKDEETSPNDY
jgi:hypothetical protein